jgi:hypothetical protein
MRRVFLIGLTLFFSFAVASGAYAMNTKGQSDNRATCRAKVAAKNVPKAQQMAEYQKCLGDPVDYH